MPTPLLYEYSRELEAAIVALRDHSRDLRRDSAGLCEYSQKLRDKSGRLLNDDARPGNAKTVAA